MTLKEVKAKVIKGDKIVQSLGIKRIYYRIYRNGRYLWTISKSQFKALSEGMPFVYNKAGTKRIFTYL